MSPNQKLGAEIRRGRKARGWSQRRLADGVGCSDGSISDYERGLHVPDRVVLGRITKLLDLDSAVVVRFAESARLADGRLASGREPKQRMHQSAVADGLRAEINSLAVGAEDALGARDADVFAINALHRRCEHLLDRANEHAYALDYVVTSRLLSVAGDVLNRWPELGLREALSRFQAALGLWNDSLRNIDLTLLGQIDSCSLSALTIQDSAVQLINLGEYDMAHTRLECLVAQMQLSSHDSPIAFPQLPEERELMRLQAMHFLTWIADYREEYGRVDALTAELLASIKAGPRGLESRRLLGSVQHRYGRSLVVRGASLAGRERKTSGGGSIAAGTRSIRTGARHIEHVDRVLSRPLNPFGPLWLTQAALYGADSSAARLLAHEKALAVDLDEIEPHVTLMEHRARRAWGLPASAVDIEELDRTLAHWEARDYKHGAYEVQFERAEALRTRRSPEAVDALLEALSLARRLGLAARVIAEIMRRLRAQTSLSDEALGDRRLQLERERGASRLLARIEDPVGDRLRRLCEAPPGCD